MADFFDRFTGTGTLDAHTPDQGTGGTWSGANADQYTLSGGSLYLSGSFPVGGNYDGYGPIAPWTPPGTDWGAEFTVGADFVAGSGPDLGIALRMIGSGGSGSYYYFELTPTAAGVCAFDLVQYIGRPTNTYLAIGTTQTGLAVAAGDVFRVEVSGTGSTVTLTVFHNGTQIYTAGDTSAARLTSAGTLALRFVSGGSSGNPDILRTLWAGAIGGPSEGISPLVAAVTYGGTQAFSATGVLSNETLNWTAGSGSVSPSSGSSTTYTAPASGSVDTVTWASQDLPTHTASGGINLSSSTSTVFHTPENNASTTVAMTRTAGATTLDLMDGSAFGTVYPKIVTVSRSGTVLCILEATALSSNTLTISRALEGTTDVNMNVGDTVELRPTKLAITELQAAIEASGPAGIGFILPTLSDSSAANGTIYLGSDHSSQLCRKDSGGTVHVIG